MKPVLTLIRKDLTLEFRRKYALFSMLLYIVATVYISYLVFNRIEDIKTWNALFWIILVFGSIQTAGRSFVQESAYRFTFYFHYIRPQWLILSKVLYNGMLLTLVGFLTWMLFGLLIGNPVKSPGMFSLTLLLAGFGFSGVLTLVGAIAAKTDQNATLMAILSIPILLPLLLTLIQTSRMCLTGQSWGDASSFLLVLGMLNVLISTLGYLLFPYIWRD
ncbi:MAG: heme exporter protein CcmB [Bacteroidota bacterium]|nr:heme exporter protein CcmB [Bacteroidota bacterium]MDX5428425.1 heme exporter protein CcmB [Bacteroidota bacterium]MDX5447057.1 heme exporter protein CcmB [Bacteroidota bacterium]MDX5506192.1 heme exporter protein CcmB [Bacteroidota bacterium]